MKVLFILVSLYSLKTTYTASDDAYNTGLGCITTNAFPWKKLSWIEFEQALVCRKKRRRMCIPEWVMKKRDKRPASISIHHKQWTEKHYWEQACMQKKLPCSRWDINVIGNERDIVLWSEPLNSRSCSKFLPLIGLAMIFWIRKVILISGIIYTNVIGIWKNSLKSSMSMMSQ